MLPPLKGNRRPPSALPPPGRLCGPSGLNVCIVVTKWYPPTIGARFDRFRWLTKTPLRSAMSAIRTSRGAALMFTGARVTTSTHWGKSSSSA